MSTSFSRNFLACLALSVIALASLSFTQGGARSPNVISRQEDAPVSGRSIPDASVTILAAGRGHPHVSFGDGVALPAILKGDSASKALLSARATVGLGLASADFDEDGMPDLVAAYGTSSGGLLTLHLGNVDAVYPNAPEAQKRRVEGTLVEAPFLPEAKLFETPERPDFIGAGDFDADGHRDVVTASAGGRTLHLHRGTGDGRLLLPESLPLPGAVTAMATGEVNRRDGLEDAVVGIETAAGARLLVFQWPGGALRGEPEAIPLPAPAIQVLLGPIDDEPGFDAAVAAEDSLLVVKGRDRRLGRTAAEQRQVGPPRIEEVPLRQGAVSLALGDFDGDGRRDLALVGGDGAVRLAPATELEKLADPDLPPRAQVEGPWPARALLARVKVSNRAGDDLAIVEAGQIRILTPPARSPAGAAPPIEAGPKEASFPVAVRLAALLAGRLNSDALDDLIVLSADQARLSVMPTETLVSLGVTNTNDSGAGSLRQAILDANATPGADFIFFDIPGGGPHTIQPLTDFPDITESVTLDATTQPGFSGTPVIELDGTSCICTGCAPPGSPCASAFDLASSGNVIRGFALNRFGGDPNVGTGQQGAIWTLGASSTRIEGNFIGTDPTGTIERSNNMNGVRLSSGCCNVIGGTVPAARNLMVSGLPGLHDVEMTDTDFNRIIGNYMGTDVTGTTRLGGLHGGVSSRLGGQTNDLGQSLPGSGNLIVGASILVDEIDTWVKGNLFGTDVSGSVAIPGGSASRALYLNNASLCLVGGATPAERNLISGSNAPALVIISGSSNWVQGNWMGTDATGASSIPNLLNLAIDSTSSNTIGGTLPGQGNVISGAVSGMGYDGDGIEVMQSTGTLVAGNFIGTDASGSMPLGNQGAGLVLVDSPNNTIGDPNAPNVISANGLEGIRIEGLASSGNAVVGNRIGTDATGSSGLGNVGTGVYVLDASSNDIGKPGPGEGNLISENGAALAVVGTNASGNSIRGNLLGTDAAGTTRLPNDSGVYLYGAPGTSMGGYGPGDRNVVADSILQVFIETDGVTTNDTSIIGNYIGTDVTGTTAFGASGSAVTLFGASNSLFDGNLISGAGTRGVRLIGASGNSFLNNGIGVDSSGAALPNGWAGIEVEAGFGNIFDSNLIAFNAQEGILLDGGAFNSVRRNSFHQNGLLGIDLTPAGVTPNDPLDADTGSNDLQNYPVITSASGDGVNAIVLGTLQSAPNTSYAIDVFKAVPCDPSGFGEGTWLGEANVTTDALGNASFSVTLAAPVSAGDGVTATATDPLNNTSEFSACVTAAVGMPPAPVSGLTWSATDPLGFEWTPSPEASSYNIYLGTTTHVPDLATSALDSCLKGTTSTASFSILSEEIPPVGEFFWYQLRPVSVFGEGDLPVGPLGPRILDSAGACGASCAHGKCDTNGSSLPLVATCDPIVAVVCDADPFCCASDWDGICRSEVLTVGDDLACEAGSCAHGLCVEGGVLTPSCDDPPVSPGCVSRICAVDPYCCDTAWDSLCVGEVGSVCGYNCN